MPIIDYAHPYRQQRVEPVVLANTIRGQSLSSRHVSGGPDHRRRARQLLPRLMLDVAVRREAMQRMGVDFQVIARRRRSSITGR